MSRMTGQLIDQLKADLRAREAEMARLLRYANPAPALIAEMYEDISVEQEFHLNRRPTMAARNSSVRLLPRLTAGVLAADFLATGFFAGLAKISNAVRMFRPSEAWA